jgi:hypothetical protein
MSLQPQPMTRWYSPPRLVSIGIRVAISTVFGEFADRREAMAGAREIDPNIFDDAYSYPRELDKAHDYPKAADGRDFWFDFVADTGDGWNPVYAIARLLADPSLSVDGLSEALPIGSFLVMGGDQVYPTASRDDYQAKLVAPYDQAAGAPGRRLPSDLYAIPGNHDWYDGLLAFLGLFCGRRLAGAWSVARPGRRIGGRETQQTRSYFALKLPNKWWLWGADIQLKGYIDEPQIDFFKHVAHEWMEEGSQLILCTGAPNWAYIDPASPEKTFKNLSYLERLAGLAHKRHRLRLVLTGDSHHYSRYREEDCQYITAGGGGAFLHPTHQLENKSFQWDWPAANTPGPLKPKGYTRSFVITADEKTGTESVFPPRETSRSLAWRNLGFAVLNWQYWLTLAAACAIFAWLLDANAQIKGSTLPAFLAVDPTLTYEALSAALGAYLELVFVTPWPLLLVAAAFGGYYYFAEFEGAARALAGGLHTAVQAGVVVIATILLSKWFALGDYRWAFVICVGVMGAVFAFGRYVTGETAVFTAIVHCAVIVLAGALLAFWFGLNPTWAMIICVGLLGGFLDATVMGVYLLICLNRLGKHWDRAFSSLRIESYKNFLRMRIGADGGLTVYPIGLTAVPRDDTTDPPANPPLKPHLIEGPIHIV